MFANTASVSNSNPFSALSVRQFIKQGMIDNKAPEAAGVLLEELEKQGVFLNRKFLLMLTRKLASLVGRTYPGATKQQS